MGKLLFRLKFWVFSAGISTAILCSFFNMGTAAAYPTIKPGLIGNDISWPSSNCNATMPEYSAFGIVGVTGGLNFTQNPCLFGESHQFNQLSLYVNTGNPESVAKIYKTGAKNCKKQDELCPAYNYGYAAAEYALLYAASQNVNANAWWLDVETMNSWSENVHKNQASIQGSIDAIDEHSFLKPKIGIYSTPRQWKIITGGWKNKLPAWVGTGSTYRTDAIAACKNESFTGGPVELTQYVLDLDHDFIC